MDRWLPLWGCTIPLKKRPILGRTLPLQDVPTLDRIVRFHWRILCTGTVRVDARRTELLSIFEEHSTQFLSNLW